MRLKNYLGITILLIIGFAGKTVWATTFEMPNYQTPTELVSEIKAKTASLQEVYGEIIWINQDLVAIKTETSFLLLKLSVNTKLFCNNLCCNWQAIRPVTEEAFFEAQIFYNEKQEILLLNAFYYGAEYLLLEVQEKTGKIILRLKNLQTETNEIIPLVPRENLLFLKDFSGNPEVVYVLYQMNGGIRAIFFQDTVQNI